jgi:hypothetical protein
MEKVEGMLFAWHRLYLQLEDARLRLKQTQLAGDDAGASVDLKARIRVLQQESDALLDELNTTMIAVRKRSGGAPPRTSSCTPAGGKEAGNAPQADQGTGSCGESGKPG